MDPTVKAILGESDTETRAYRITAQPEHLNELEKLFSWMNMTRGGHSGAASVSIDGDGAARVTVEKEKGDLEPYDQDKVKNSQRIEYSVGLE